MDEQEFRDRLHQWGLNNPHYYTDDGTHFFSNPSYRKAKSLIYLGRHPNTKEARLYFEDLVQQLSRV